MIPLLGEHEKKDLVQEQLIFVLSNALNAVNATPILAAKDELPPLENRIGSI